MEESKIVAKIEYERRVHKLQAYNRMKVTNDLKKQRKSKDLDDYYNNKLERMWRRYEKRYDATTRKKVAEAKLKEREKNNKDKTRTNSLREKEALKIAKAKEKLQSKIVKDKTKKKDKNIKQRAFSMFQLYIRISKSDMNGYVILMDKPFMNAMVLWNQCVAGHMRPKQRYPQLVFIEDNVRPITAGTNEMQGDNFGDRRVDNLRKTIGEERYQALVELAEDKAAKNELRSTAYYYKMYEYYKSKVIIEFMKRGIELPKMP